MIQLSKTSRDTVMRVLIVVSLFFMTAFLLESHAGTKEQHPPDSKSASDEIPMDNVVFDGQGTVDSVNPFIIPETEEGRKNFAASLLLMIDGTQQQFSQVVKLHHFLQQPVTEHDIKPGISVGFLKDPDDKIAELWILKPAPVKVEDLILKPKKTTKPSNAQDTWNSVKNEGGVWKN